MIKVILTGPSLNESVGGIAIHIKNLLELFNGSQSVQVDHFAITAAKYDRESWAKKIQRFIAILRPFVAKLNAYDVVHLNSTFDNRSVIRDFYYAVIAILANGPDVVIQFHGGEPSKVYFFKNKMFRSAFKWLFSGERRVLVLSEFQQKQFEYFFPNAAVTLVPNCLPIIKQTRKIKKGNVVTFLFIGRISESKGILRIIRAAELLKGNGQAFKINICGKGPLQEKLVEEIYLKQLQPFVNYLGFVSGRTKENILQQSDVMLLPTDHNEGFPYALLEAFSYGIPVIGTRKGAIPEVIDDGVNGFILDSKDERSLFEKMRYFCLAAERATLMGKNGRDKLNRKYTSDILLKKLTTTYSG